MKKISIFIFTVFTCIILNAQSNYYYYYKGNKIPLQVDKKYLNITTEDSFQKTSVSELNIKDFTLQNENIISQKFAKIEFETTPSDLEFIQKINSLKQNANVRNVSLYFKRNNNKSIGISNIFYVKLKNVNDYSILQQISNQKNVQIIKQLPNMPLWYILSLNKTNVGNVIDVTNYFYETGFFWDIDPAFMFDFKIEDSNNTVINQSSTLDNCANDTRFVDLWGLKNNINPNIDINICEAWGISEGNNSKVAIIDSGIYAHADLWQNFLADSYDSTTGLPASTPGTSGHRTFVTGIIAAVKIIT